MSTTTNRPGTPVTWRITRSGSSYRAEPRFGVTHPFTQSTAAGPRLAGGSSGSAGGVGDAVGPVAEMGVTAEEVGGTSGSASPVHAASESATTTTTIAVENLC
ncbi:MAG: hypothetical protein ABWX92_15320 [Mycetocola sp.]